MTSKEKEHSNPAPFKPLSLKMGHGINILRGTDGQTDGWMTEKKVLRWEDFRGRGQTDSWFEGFCDRQTCIGTEL